MDSRIRMLRRTPFQRQGAGLGRRAWVSSRTCRTKGSDPSVPVPEWAGKRTLSRYSQIDDMQQLQRRVPRGCRMRRKPQLLSRCTLCHLATRNNASVKLKNGSKMGPYSNNSVRRTELRPGMQERRKLKSFIQNQSLPPAPTTPRPTEWGDRD